MKPFIAAFCLLVCASVARADDSCAHDARSLVGPYEGQLVHTVPAGFPVFNIRMVFFADGNFGENHQPYQATGLFGPIVLTASIGSWKKTGCNTFQVSLAQDAEGGPDSPYAGVPLGTNRVLWTVTVDATTGNLSGPWVAQLYDPTGAPIPGAATNGTISAVIMPSSP